MNLLNRIKYVSLGVATISSCVSLLDQRGTWYALESVSRGFYDQEVLPNLISLGGLLVGGATFAGIKVYQSIRNNKNLEERRRESHIPVD